MFADCGISRSLSAFYVVRGLGCGRTGLFTSRCLTYMTRWSYYSASVTCVGGGLCLIVGFEGLVYIVFGSNFSQHRLTDCWRWH